MTEDEKNLVNRLDEALAKLDKTAFINGLLLGTLMNVRMMLAQIPDDDEGVTTAIGKAIDGVKAEVYPLIESVYYPERKPPPDIIK